MKAISRTSLIAAGLLLLTACASDPRPQHDFIRVMERFGGTLPCSDCQGIHTDLILKRNASTGAPAGFYLHEVRIDAPGGERVNSVWGQWSQYDRDGNLQSELYVLQPEVGKLRRYQASADGKLQPLDDRGNPINSAEGTPVVLNRLASEVATL